MDDQLCRPCNLAAITRSEHHRSHFAVPPLHNSMRARPHQCLGARPPELGHLGGVGWFSLLDVKLNGNFSFLTSTLLSTVSKSQSFCLNRSSLARFYRTSGSDPVGIVTGLSNRMCAGVCCGIFNLCDGPRVNCDFSTD